MCLTVFKAVMDMGKGEGDEEENKTERKLIRRLPPTDPDKWNALPQVPNRSEVGYLHLSFEYHKGALRVRVWQISDLLLPPPQISMIHSIFVRGYFLPDKVKKTHRRTEEVLVDIPDKNGVDGATAGIQHIFTPSSFKFSTPLLYTGMTTAIIRERSLQLEVCLTQKHTHRVYLSAMVHMPLRTALRRPIRERYPLIPCLNHTTPNNMRVYSATFLPHLTGGDNSQGLECKGDHQPNGLVPGNGLTGNEAELEEDAVSLTGDDFLRSHLSLCLDEDSDQEGLARSSGDRMTASQASSGVGSGTSSSSNTLNNPSSGDEADADGQYDGDESQDVQSDPGIASTRNTPLDRSLSDTSNVSATKKKIIPNELLDKDGHELNTGKDESTSADMIPNFPSKQPVKEIPESSSASNTTFSPVLDSSIPSDKNIQSEDPKTSQDLNNSVRRKIIPDADLDIPRASGGEEKRSQREDLSRNNPSSEVAGDRSPGQKVAAGTENHVHTQDSSPQTKPTTNTNNNTQPPAELANSDSLVPANPTSTSLSPLTDSGFASRPETPCWDFYDFSEDLKPEMDLEMGSQCLEESLAQLRQEGMGSLQNLSLEPILPMVLVDDFDTLTVDDE